MFKKIAITSLGFCLIVASNQAQPKSIKPDIQVIVTCGVNMKIGEEIYIDLVIKNNSLDSVTVPERLYFAWGRNPDIDLTFHVQKLEKNGKVDQHPYGDYNNRDFAENGKVLVKLASNTIKKYNINLTTFFHLQKKGRYRAKAKFIAPLTNEILYSNWVYFNVM